MLSTLAQTRMGVSRITFPSRGVMEGQCLPYVKVPKLVLYVCYFLFKTWFDRVTFTSTELVKGQNVLHMAKT